MGSAVIFHKMLNESLQRIGTNKNNFYVKTLATMTENLTESGQPSVCLCFFFCFVLFCFTLIKYE